MRANALAASLGASRAAARERVDGSQQRRVRRQRRGHLHAEGRGAGGGHGHLYTRMPWAVESLDSSFCTPCNYPLVIM